MATYNPGDRYSDYLDWINVLTIDFDTPSPFNSPGKTGPVDAWLGCGKGGIKDWKEWKVPTENLVLGLPFHGYNHGNEHHDDIATKIKEAFRGINLGGYFAWHLASDDDNWTLSNAAANALDNAINNQRVDKASGEDLPSTEKEADMKFGHAETINVGGDHRVESHVTVDICRHIISCLYYQQ